MRRWVIILLVVVVVVVAVAASVSTYLAIDSYGLAPETAALVIASATLVGALSTLVVNAYIARSQQKLTQDLEAQRAQAEALQNYLVRIGELASSGLRQKADPYDDKRILARVQTKTVLRGLAANRKRDVLLFLREMRLINRDAVEFNEGKVHPRIIGLSGADLSGADLSGASLISTSREEFVSLEGASLEGANLTRADLEGADLRAVNFKEATLTHANLKDADLSNANLLNADLRGANLDSANVTQDQLNAAKSLPQ